MNKLRAGAAIIGLVLPLLYGCEQTGEPAPTELSVQGGITRAAVFGAVQNDIIGWEPGTYFTDVPEIMSAEGIYRQDGRKRRLVWTSSVSDKTRRLTVSFASSACRSPSPSGTQQISS